MQGAESALLLAFSMSYPWQQHGTLPRVSHEHRYPDESTVTSSAICSIVIELVQCCSHVALL